MPLRVEDDDTCSAKLDLSAHSYARNEIAMNAVASAQVWHRWLGHLNKRSLKVTNMQKFNAVTFNGFNGDSGVCALWKRHRLPNPKHATVDAQLHLVYRDDDPAQPTASGGYEFVPNPRPVDQVDRSVPSLRQQRSYRLASAVRHYSGDTTRQTSRQMACRKMRQIYLRRRQGLPLRKGITQELAVVNTPQQMGVSECVGQTLCRLVPCMFVDIESPLFPWGKLMITAL